MASVKVAVRVRPVDSRELANNTNIIVSVEQKTINLKHFTIPKDIHGRNSSDVLRDFEFDECFWSVNKDDDHHASQEVIHTTLGLSIIDAILSGYNACVFAYGQTGSGKTYTMIGKQDDRGLIPNICEGLLEKLEDINTRIHVSYLEIYNEKVTDLLDRKSKNLKIREHPKTGPYVQNLTRHRVVDYSAIASLLEMGTRYRTTASTLLNEESSRSHAVFTLRCTQISSENSLVPSELHSKLHLIDLAGSERSDAAGTTGKRLKEGASINRSLVTLGSVISALAQRSSTEKHSERCTSNKTPTKSCFIPYRNSTLTWLLKDSLGGNSKTVMIATISPCAINYSETLSTLRYASIAKNIVNTPRINEDPNVKLIRELREENKRLTNLLDEKNTDKLKVRMNTNELLMNELINKWNSKWIQNSFSFEHVNKPRAQNSNTMQPHLLSLDDENTDIYFLNDEITTLGKTQEQTNDIELSGENIRGEHCRLRQCYSSNDITLEPLDGASVCVNGENVDETIILKQGAVICVGDNHMFKFNNPRLINESRSFSEMETSTHSMFYDRLTTSCTSISDSAIGSDLDLHCVSRSYCNTCCSCDGSEPIALVGSESFSSIPDNHTPRANQPHTPTMLQRSPSLPQSSKVNRSYPCYDSANDTDTPLVDKSDLNLTFLIDSSSNTDGITSPNIQLTPRNMTFEPTTRTVATSPLLDTTDIVAEINFKYDAEITKILEERMWTNDITEEKLEENIKDLDRLVSKLHADQTAVFSRNQRKRIAIRPLSECDELTDKTTRAVHCAYKLISTKKFNSPAVMKRLKSIESILNMSKKFSMINEKLILMQALFDSEKYNCVIPIVSDIGDILNSLEGKGEIDLEVITGFKTETCVLREKTLFECSELWKKNLIWTETEDKTELTIVDHDTLYVSAVAMSHSMLDNRIDQLVNKFSSNFVTHLLKESTLTDGFSVTRLDADPTSIIGALSDIECLLLRLTSCFDGKRAYDDVCKRFATFTFASILKNDAIYDSLVSALDANVTSLLTFDPNLRLSWRKFVDIHTQCERFDAAVYHSDANRSLISSIKPVTLQFINGYKESMISRCHVILARDQGQDSINILNNIPEEHSLNIEFLYDCPDCILSRSRMEFVNLCKEILEDLEICDEMFKLSLLNCLECLIIIYSKEYSISDEISDFNIGVQHNNNTFISRSLNALLNEQKITSIDLYNVIDELYENSNKIFSAYLETVNIKSLLLLNPDDFMICLADNHDHAIICIKDVFENISSLNNNWKSVLTSKFRYKAIGYLVSNTLKSITESIVKVRRWSSEDCKFLVVLIRQQLTEAALSLFNGNVVEVEIYVPIEWLKICELSLIFDSPLQVLISEVDDEVMDRWCEGKGPLSIYFDEHSLTDLMKSVFENTSRRREFLKSLNCDISYSLY